MNSLASQLLAVMNEEEAFWTLCQIVESYFSIDYFSNFFGVLIDQDVLKDLLAERNHELSDHFDDLDFPLNSFSVQWFVELFVK